MQGAVHAEDEKDGHYHLDCNVSHNSDHALLYSFAGACIAAPRLAAVYCGKAPSEVSICRAVFAVLRRKSRV